MGRRSVAELVSNFYGAEIDFCSSQEMLKTLKNCAKVASNPVEGYLKSA